MKRMELITPLTPIHFLFICISHSAYFYALSTSRISEYIYVAFFAHFRLFIYRKIPQIISRMAGTPPSYQLVK